MENIRLKDIGKDVQTSKHGGGLKRSEKVNIGDNTITVTDPYGIRQFKGREGQHSTGIDYVTNSGNAVAVTGGQIIAVKAQYSRSAGKPSGTFDVASIDLTDQKQAEKYKDASRTLKPTEGQSGGFYVTVKNDDGTYAQYMHLDPLTPEQASQLQGKRLNRGDVIGSYGIKGSGSMTGKHVKLRVYADPKAATKSHLDPSAYIKGEVTSLEITPSETEAITKPSPSYAYNYFDLANTALQTQSETQASNAEKDLIKQTKVDKSADRQAIEEDKKSQQDRTSNFLNAFSQVGGLEEPIPAQGSQRSTPIVNSAEIPVALQDVSQPLFTFE